MNIKYEFQNFTVIFQPGIWRAVECDDAMAVRRLVNQWCNIRVTKVHVGLCKIRRIMKDDA